MKSVLEEVEEMKNSQNKVEQEVDNQIPTAQENSLQTNAANVSNGDTGMSVTTAQEGINKMIKKTIAEGKDIKDMARDLTYLAGASNLQTNDEFKDKYQEALGEQLLEDLKSEGKREAIKEAARKQEAKNIRAQAFYNGCKPIFALLGIEEAFGLVAMIITVTLLMIPFLVVSLIRFIINSVNSVFTSIAGFKKPAFWLCTIVVCLVITAAIVLAALFGVDKIFGTHIILR